MFWGNFNEASIPLWKADRTQLGFTQPKFFSFSK